MKTLQGFCPSLYLQEPTISSQAVENAGGYMAYWHAALQSRPLVAKMAMDFVSAPGNLCLVFSSFFPSLILFSYLC
jgi:hypothetical protein